jgi:hypothetical protein
MSMVLSTRMVASTESTVWRWAMLIAGLVNFREERLLLGCTELRLIPSDRHNWFGVVPVLVRLRRQGVLRRFAR